jgi:hypothetical protein
MVCTSANRPAEAGGRVAGAADVDDGADDDDVDEGADDAAEVAAVAAVAPSGGRDGEQPPRASVAHSPATKRWARGRMGSSGPAETGR